MKHLFLTFACVIPFLAVGMDAPQQISFLHATDSTAKDIRRAHIYPRLYIQDLGRLVQVNEQYRKEIGCISVYQETDFQGLKEAIQSAWLCYDDVGCNPKLEFCFMNVSQRGQIYENTFKVSQEQLIAHWIKKILISELWSKKKFFVPTDLLWRVCSSSNNHIALKSANADNTMICIDAPHTKQKDVLNNIMTIYSIGKNNESLDQEELDVIINNKIKIPLVIILERGVLQHEKTINMLLNQLKKCEAEENPVIGCRSGLVQLNVFFDLIQLTKKEVKEAHQEGRDKNDLQGRWQIVPSHQGTHRQLPKSKNCLIQ